jgi:hypothetical protein
MTQLICILSEPVNTRVVLAQWDTSTLFIYYANTGIILELFKGFVPFRWISLMQVINDDREKLIIKKQTFSKKVPFITGSRENRAKFLAGMFILLVHSHLHIFQPSWVFPPNEN